MATKLGLPPVIDKESRILILGTLPGDESIRLQQYYADPGNQFWDVLSNVYAESIGQAYEDRLRFLRHHGLALWDVLRSTERIGSTDKAIRNPVPNDFNELFATYGQLSSVAFNGSQALALFRRLVEEHSLSEPGSLRRAKLPSTSSAPGRYVLPFGKKAARWGTFLGS